MKIFPELKKIAGKNMAVDRLGEKLAKELGMLDAGWRYAYLITGCKERGGHLYRHGEQLDRQGLVNGIYYCDQRVGCCEDDYYGTMYFKTNVPGQFVALPFSC